MPEFPYGLGAKPSIPDHRDFTFRLAASPVAPVDVDLRAQAPVIWDQGQLGSCVAHGTLRAYNHIQRLEGKRRMTPSMLFTYYVGRELEGSVDVDAGLELRDGPKAVAKEGVTDRTHWPYDISRFMERPPERAWKQADRHLATQYSSLVDHRSIHNALQVKHPVIMGFAVFESFFNIGKDGGVPLPQPNETIVGGHCMLIEGYRARTDDFIVANSWGRGFGDDGYVYFPAQLFDPDRRIVFTNDLWVLEAVT